jgi:succinate dehydrogenase/fumarate reductase cytochrome b subunit
VIAPIAALAYPGLVWCGPRLSPGALVVSLAVPALGVVAAHRLGGSTRYPRARRIAHVAVAAPPLFSLLGGWFDFQHAIPLGSVGWWIPLWCALIVASLVERPRSAPSDVPRRRRLAVAHGAAAATIAVFAVAHLVNHLGGVIGGQTHLAIMHALRTVYRHRLVEPVLLGALGFQIVTGFVLLRHKLARATSWLETLQTTTGGYLLMFLLSHVSAVMRARYLRHTETDWHWLSPGGELLTDPWSARLVPYYFLAVIAFGTHAACGLHAVLRSHGASRPRATGVVVGIIGAAVVASGAIMFGLLRP